MKNKKVFLIIIFIAILGMIGYLAYKKYNSEKQQTQRQGENFSIVVKENSTDKTKSDIYLKDEKTNKETLFLTLTDLYIGHYHNAEYHNGNVYVIRRTGGEYGYLTNPNWTDELWKYNQEKQGKKLYSNRGLDFRVSDDEKFIAIDGSGPSNAGGETLVILDNSGSVLKTLNADPTPEDLFGALFWHNHDFWAKKGFGGLRTIVKISAENFAITSFDVSALPIQREFNINPTKEKIAFSDYPAISDVDSGNEFRASKKTVSLFVYDLNSKEKQLVATSVVKQFNPKWIDTNTIEYDNPSGEGRVQKTIN